MRAYLVVTAAAVVAATLGAVPAHAQGSSVYTHSACMTARGGAGVAVPCDDGSAIFYNPAALATQGSVFGLGVTAIRTGGSFIYDGTGQEVTRENAITPVPHGWLNVRATDRLAAGIGVWAPYGLGIEWPTEFEGRYVGYDNSLRTIYVQPTVAFQVVPGLLSVGAGFDYVRGSIKIAQRLDLSTQATPIPGVTFGQLGIPRGTDFAEGIMEGDGTGMGWHVGLQMKTDRIAVGARYMHSVNVRFEDGQAHFHPIATGQVLPPNNPFGLPAGTPVDALLTSSFNEGSPLCHQSVETDITFPSQFVGGVQLRLTPAVTVSGDYQWTQWQSFDEFPLAFEYAPTSALIMDYRNTNTVRFGVDFAATEALMLRAGYSRNDAATPDETVTPLLPEATRNIMAAGLSYRLPIGLTADVAYQYVDQADRRGRVLPRPTRDLGAEDLNVGVYTTTGHLLGVTLSYQLGGLLHR